MSIRRCAIAVVCLVVAALAPRSQAHPPVPTVAIIDVQAGGHVHITVTHDALAYALNDTSVNVTDPQMHALLKGAESELAAALQDGRERFAGSFRLFADGAPITCAVDLAPTMEGMRRWIADHPTLRLPCTMDYVLSAELPPGTHELAVRLPPVLSDVLVSFERPGLEPLVIPLAPGEMSPAVDVRMASPPSGSEPPTEITSGAPPPRLIGVLAIAWRYLRLGYTHIIPYGADHALFVIGLFLLTPRVKDLVWQITMFTIAHSVTLTLATLGIVRISPSIVEPVIALTIMFIAIENLISKEARPWRGAIAFVFGLVHGLGFASALMSVGLPTGQLATGLIAFNVGVEGGHITVLGLAFLLLGWWRDKPWYRARITIPLSIIIALIAGVWMIRRVVF